MFSFYRILYDLSNSISSLSLLKTSSMNIPIISISVLLDPGGFEIPYEYSINIE